MSGSDARSASMSELYALWSIQDGLLQNYRMIFITSEAILFSVAAAVAATRAPWLTFIIAVPGLALMFMWTSITRTRAEHVSFVQQMIREAEEGNPPSQPLKRFKAHQDASEGRSVDVSLKSHETRRQLEVWLPRFFGLAWLLLLVSALYLWAG